MKSLFKVLIRTGTAVVMIAAMLLSLAASPSAAAEPAAVKTIAAGDDHNCFLGEAGTVVCVGDNDSGQLGNGTIVDASRPVAVTGISTAIAVTAGQDHSCALLSDLTARCWGKNSQGQLGNGTLADSSTPVVVTGLNNVISLVAGDLHTCAVKAGGQALCWGENAQGQLGNGTTQDSTIPSSVTGVTNAVTIAGGQFHSCAVLANGSAACWGQNTWGQLGNGLNTDALTAQSVVGLSGVNSIATGFDHTCAATTDGSVHCWGSNESGQLGRSDLETNRNTPTKVSNVTGVTQVAAGFRYTCSAGSGAITCWGDNKGGQIGNGLAGDNTFDPGVDLNQPTPFQVSLSGGAAVATGDHHTCAVAAAGIFCWGDNNDGQLGDGTTVDKLTPVSVGVEAVDPGPTPDPDPVPDVRYPTLQAMTTAPEFSVADANTLRLYDAFFLRTPEIKGANYWVGLTRGGASLDTLAYQFAVSDEFKNRYGSLDNREYVTVIYANVLNRPPDNGGFEYWLGLLNDGQLNRGGVVRWIAANSEFRSNNLYGGK